MLHPTRSLREILHPLSAAAAVLLPVLLCTVTPGPVPELPGATPACAATQEADADESAPGMADAPVRERALHLGRLGASRWLQAGYRGQGIKVAVLDSGFRGYRAFLGKALPARVTTRSFRHDGNLEARDSQHGILCGEVVHALAPQAELLFANWEPETPQSFVAAVAWARQQGARIITCSVIMPGWSDGEGGGPVHDALAQVLRQGDGNGLFFACAGNVAQRHWHGTYAADGQQYHAWKPGCVDNLLSPWGTETVAVEVYGHSGGDYELVVQDATSGTEVGRAQTRGPGACCGGVVRFQPETGHDYRVRVRLVRGEPGRFHLVALGSGLEYATARGSIPFPADGPEVVAVGAVDAEGRRLAYSACGPNSREPKPDLVAPVPFPSLWRAKPFSGTSAAAPQAAGLAALVWARHPGWSAPQVRSILRTSTRDLLQPGHDWETGYGLVQLPWQSLAGR